MIKAGMKENGNRPGRSRYPISVRSGVFAVFANLAALCLWGGCGWGASAWGGTSALWGVKGELWDPLGRLPDFSYAGYHAGEKAIPTPPVTASVKDFGCKGDGKSDDSQCLQRAVDSAAPGALLIPRGRYLLSKQILVRKSGLVLRGEGQGADGTVLVWSKGLQELTGAIHPWNWGASGLLRFAPANAAISAASSASPSIAGASIAAIAPHPGALAKTADHPPSHELALGEQVATVTTAAKRGDIHLHLSATAGLLAGQFIVLTLTDPADRSLNSHLHNDQGSNDYNQDMPLRWVVKIRALAADGIDLAQPLRCDARPAWLPRINRYKPIEESGVENLRFEFPDVAAYAGHQLEPGFNALAFEGALDCWALDITIRSCDNGPSLEDLTKNCSVLGLTQLARYVPAINGRISGHHGFSFNINSHDNLLSGFTFTACFIHGVSVGYNASGNVARSGSGTDLNLDHHSRSPFENLYSNLDLGLGEYPFLPVVGAGGDVLRSGARGTVWNVKSVKGAVAPPPFAYVQYNVIGTDQDKRTADREWLEKVADLQPPDLYLSQLEKRLGATSAARTVPADPSGKGTSRGFDAAGRSVTGTRNGRSRIGKHIVYPLK